MIVEPGKDDRLYESSEFEFNPLYQYYSPSGFKVEQKRDSRMPGLKQQDVHHSANLTKLDPFPDSLDLLEEFCDEIMPEHLMGLSEKPNGGILTDRGSLGSIYGDYHQQQPQKSFDSPLTENRYRSKSVGNFVAAGFPGEVKQEPRDPTSKVEFLDLTFPDTYNFDLPLATDFTKFPEKYSNNDVRTQQQCKEEPQSQVESPRSRQSLSPNHFTPAESPSNVQPSYPQIPTSVVSENLLVFESKFLKKYWRNDRKNIQCFPTCPEFGDYYNVRTQKQVHKRTGGTCGSPVVAKLCNNTDNSADLISLGRIAIYHKEVEQNFNYNHEINKRCERIISTEEFNEMAKDSVQGVFVEESSHRSKQVVFKVGVWKLNMQLSKVRRPTNLPSKVPFYIFEALVLKPLPGGNGFSLIARNTSNRFSIASTRTLLREIKARNSDSSHPSSPTSGNTSPASSPFPSSSVSTPSEPSSSLYPDLAQLDYPSLVDQPNQGFPMQSTPVANAPTYFNLKTRKFQDTEDLTILEPEINPLQFKKSRTAFTPYQASAPADAANSQPDPSDLESGVAQVRTRNILHIESEPQTNISSGIVSTLNSDRYAQVLAQNQVVSLQEAWLWGVGLGLFGGHHFYLNRPKQGFMYMVTLGVFGLGWLKDILTMPYIVSRHKVSNAVGMLELPVFEEVHLAECYVMMLPFGIIGAHYFHMGKYGAGLLYLFTLGLLGLGFLWDLITLSSIVAKENERRREIIVERFGRQVFEQTAAFNTKYKPNTC